MAQENDSDTELVQPCSVSESPGAGLERMRQTAYGAWHLGRACLIPVPFGMIIAILRAV